MKKFCEWTDKNARLIKNNESEYSFSEDFIAESPKKIEFENVN